MTKADGSRLIPRKHAETLVLLSVSVEKYYIALTETQLKICRFHDSLSQKGSRPLVYDLIALQKWL